MEIIYNNKTFLTKQVSITMQDIQECIQNVLKLEPNDYYLISNGKRISDNNIPCTNIHVVPKLIGGKGGFGSMLRAIGAQIEKTTNREACRDLSGRRLRDINEEQRLKNWIATQAEREKEAKERKRKKLEKLCEQPKHEFKDDQYYKDRQTLPEKVEDAVAQGFEAACSSSKRKQADTSTVKKKRAKLWIDEDEELSSSDDDSDEEKKETIVNPKDDNNKSNEDIVNEEDQNSGKSEDKKIN